MSDTATTQDLDRELERYRRELTGYCYRMLGSSFEAEDAVQDTMVRAWRNIEKFEGRSSLRSWLLPQPANERPERFLSRPPPGRPREHTPPPPP
ncbi:sigma factor, partial [Streptomyces sp. NPDC059130]|uniref:sigma factor n=1 Tax=Streptomyces sp. NPDC059130 TaxID=3346735 RepID=UPI0036B539B2